MYDKQNESDEQFESNNIILLTLQRTKLMQKQMTIMITNIRYCQKINTKYCMVQLIDGGIEVV